MSLASNLTLEEKQMLAQMRKLGHDWTATGIAEMKKAKCLMEKLGKLQEAGDIEAADELLELSYGLPLEG